VTASDSGRFTARRSLASLALMLASLSLYTFADLATKEWALDALSLARPMRTPALCQANADGEMPWQRVPKSAHTLVDGVLELSYAENCGAAFGLLRDAPSWVRAAVFGLAAVGAAIVLTVTFMRGFGGRSFVIAVPLILSGAIGNLTDRLRHGYVVDFIQIDPRLFSYPTFNVADIAITIGVALLLIDSMKTPDAASGAPPTVAKDAA